MVLFMFAGEVELENLPLKKDALKSLDLPLEVKAGKDCLRLSDLN